MSADNWSKCPRCTEQGEAQLAAEEAAIQRSYGVVSVEEFDRARAALVRERDKHVMRQPTFREDYEIYGAETGTVTISYHGQCQDCGLKLSIREEREIPGWREVSA